MNRLQNIDVLRVLAALAVLLFHFTYRGHAADGLNPFAYPEIDWLTRYLYLGVSLFFMISGFVIAYSAENRSWHAFALSRVARIYPAFLVCMTITSVAISVLYQGISPMISVGMKQYLSNLIIFAPFLDQPYIDGAYWSIALEVIFYAWVTLFIYLKVFESRQLMLIAIWLFVSAVIHYCGLSALMVKLFVADYSGHFSLGIISYRIFKRKGLASSGEIILMVLALITALHGELKIMDWNIIHYGMHDYFGLLVIATTGSLFLVNLAAYMRPWLSLQLSVALGALTYPLYLLHQIIGYIVFQHLHASQGQWTALFITMSIVIGLAYIISQYAEPIGRKLIINGGNFFFTPKHL